MMNPIPLIMGPTASGKTGLSLQLAEALAQRGRPVEIITVDSAQVYRGMDIGTAKPEPAMRAMVPHHLIDILDPVEPYSAARFGADALRLIHEIRSRGREPLLVGGTMLYFRALTRGLSDLPAADPEIRARLEALAQREGWPAMHARLAARDPTTAARLHPNDRQRIQRALEVVEGTGQTLSTLQGSGVGCGLPFVKLALMPPDRAVLHRRIEQRWSSMMAAGLVEEVERLRARGDLHPELPSIRAVGYRQLWDYLDGGVTLAETQARALAATRQFAKRQITWLRSEHDLCWINPEDPDVLQQALRLIGTGTP